MSCGFLQDAVEATYRRYVLVARLTFRYPKALWLVKKVNDETAISDSAAGIGELDIAHLDSYLPFESRNQNALVFLEAALAQKRT